MISSNISTCHKFFYNNNTTLNSTGKNLQEMQDGIYRISFTVENITKLLWAFEKPLDKNQKVRK